MNTDKILGFDFGGTKVDIGVGMVDGILVEDRRLLVRDYSTVEDLVQASIDQGLELDSSYHVGSVGVSTMGITYDDHVELAPNVPGWEGLHLPLRFSRAFKGLPTVIENDVRAACRAELLWGSLRGETAAAYLNLGTGIAMSFVVDGHLWRGAHGASGEIAYLWRQDEPGFSHGCAPFEEKFGGRGLDHLVATRFPPLTSLDELFDDATQVGSELFLKDVFRVIARRVGHALLALDVGVVSVGGGIARRFETFAPIFEKEWGLYLPYPPRLVPSRFKHRTGLYGALALAASGGADG